MLFGLQPKSIGLAEFKYKLFHKGFLNLNQKEIIAFMSKVLIFFTAPNPNLNLTTLWIKGAEINTDQLNENKQNLFI